MTRVNVGDRTIDAKVVYYGAGHSGKTTNLSYIHGVVDPHDRLELVSLSTGGDRTLFFDFVPLPLGSVRGYDVRMQAYTVPGQARYDMTRRYVLRGADGIVFVADSRPEALDANVDALVGLRDNLLANGLDPQTTPIVIQYNKRDVAGAAGLRELRAALNREGLPEVEAVASSGHGVWESFSRICADVLERVVDAHDLGDPREARRELEELLAGLGPDAPAGVAPGPYAPEASSSGDGVLLLEPVTPIPAPPPPEATGDGNGAAPAAAPLHGRASDALHDVGMAAATERDLEPLLARSLEVCVAALAARGASVLLFDASRERLAVAAANGLEDDPIAGDGEALPRRRERILRGLPFTVSLERAADPAPAAAVIAPLALRGDVHGALVVYLDASPADPRADERFLRGVAAPLAALVENESLRRRLEGFEDAVERAVSDRTRELSTGVRAVEERSRSGAGFQASVCEGALRSVRSLAALADALGSGEAAEPRAIEAERGAFTGVVQREARRLEERLCSLLDLARLEAGEVELRPAAHDLRRHLQAAYRRLHPLFKEKRLRIRVFADEPLEAWVDERWLVRLLDGVLVNAAAFAPAGSEVQATLRPLDGAACVEIRDQGATLAPDGDLDERLRPSGDEALRVALGRAVAARLGGSSWYRPADGDGSGNVFALSLPLASG